MGPRAGTNPPKSSRTREAEPVGRRESHLQDGPLGHRRGCGAASISWHGTAVWDVARNGPRVSAGMKRSLNATLLGG